MTGKIWAVFWGLLLISSCGRYNEVAVPKDVLPQDSMIAMITDMHLIEGGKLGRKIMGDSLLLVDDYYFKLYEKYNVSKERYKKSYSFYAENPKLMAKIYEKVLENLNQIQASPKWKDEEGTSEKKAISKRIAKLDSLKRNPSDSVQKNQ